MIKEINKVIKTRDKQSDKDKKMVKDNKKMVKDRKRRD